MAFKKVFKLHTVLAGIVLLCGCETLFKQEPTYLVRKQSEENQGAYIISNPRTLLAGGHKIEINKKAAMHQAVVAEKPRVKVPSDVELADALSMRRQKEIQAIVAYQCALGACANESMHIHIKTPSKKKNIANPVLQEERIPVSAALQSTQVNMGSDSERLWQNDKNKIMQELGKLKRKIDKQLTKSSVADIKQEKTYRVQEGDSLWEIAGMMLGNPYRWMEIYSLNRDVLTSPHQLYPGLTLLLPEKDEEKETVN